MVNLRFEFEIMAAMLENLPRSTPEGVLPYIDYVGMCHCSGYGF